MRVPQWCFGSKLYWSKHLLRVKSNACNRKIIGSGMRLGNTRNMVLRDKCYVTQSDCLKITNNSGYNHLELHLKPVLIYAA